MKILSSYVFFVVLCGLALSQLDKDRKCLREKVITFPQLATNTWVKLHPNESMDMSAATVCLQFYSEQMSLDPCLFSLATPSYPQDFSLRWLSFSKQYEMTIHSFKVQFGLVFKNNQWISMCATWDANSGLAQMFVNKVASFKKEVGPKVSFKGDPVITLGQFQTQYDGGFDQHNAFTGFIADVHVHEQVLTIRQIKTYMEAKTRYKLGNYINWHNLMYSIAGSAQVEEKHQVTFYSKEEQQ
ncbi:C-reactive protein-like isoform X2 [Sinocyclocheilus grahami]|uniref:C-reactive protein-like isoform X2 n=1 Tax=Sinocyclocheilus grahami TaxID=75366 RepID=UPI0007AD22D8|nr:PREDICTED: C-reactive protein-like isoform X2 [Sinocyclocheilus grahami]